MLPSISYVGAEEEPRSLSPKILSKDEVRAASGHASPTAPPPVDPNLGRKLEFSKDQGNAKRAGGGERPGRGT